MPADSVSARIYPAGILTTLSKMEVERLHDASRGDLSALLRRCALAFATDRSLLATCVLPHPLCIFDRNVTAVSLNHSVWFHDDYNPEEWLLYVTDSPWAGAGRGLNRGSIYRRDGQLVASSAQETLIHQH